MLFDISIITSIFSLKVFVDLRENMLPWPRLSYLLSHGNVTSAGVRVRLRLYELI